MAHNDAIQEFRNEVRKQAFENSKLQDTIKQLDTEIGEYKSKLASNETVLEQINYQKNEYAAKIVLLKNLAEKTLQRINSVRWTKQLVDQKRANTLKIKKDLEAEHARKIEEKKKVLNENRIQFYQSMVKDLKEDSPLYKAIIKSKDIIERIEAIKTAKSNAYKKEKADYETSWANIVKNIIEIASNHRKVRENQKILQDIEQTRKLESQKKQNEGTVLIQLVDAVAETSSPYFKLPAIPERANPQMMVSRSMGNSVTYSPVFNFVYNKVTTKTYSIKSNADVTDSEPSQTLVQNQDIREITISQKMSNPPFDTQKSPPKALESVSAEEFDQTDKFNSQQFIFNTIESTVNTQSEMSNDFLFGTANETNEDDQNPFDFSDFLNAKSDDQHENDDMEFSFFKTN